MVIEKTRAVNEIIEVMIAASSARAPSGPPANRNGSRSEVSSDSSSAVTPSASRLAAIAKSSGTAQKRCARPFSAGFTRLVPACDPRRCARGPRAVA